jgi:signal transduction histidine kinase
MPERTLRSILLVADVARFQGLVEDLLEISADAGSARLNLEEVRGRRARAERRRGRARISTSGDRRSEVNGDTVRADKRRMVRSLANLIDSARLHGGGGERVSVRHVKGNGR